MMWGTDASPCVQIVTNTFIRKVHQKNDLQNKNVFAYQYFLWFCILLVFFCLFFFFFINHSILGQNGIMLCSVHVFLSYQKGLTHRTKWTFLKYWICFCGSSENQTKCARNSWCIETYKPQFQSNAEIKNLIMFSAKNDLNFKFQFKPMFNLKR